MEAQKHRPLQVGLHLPKATEMHGGGTAGWPELLAMAREAEAVGFDSLWVMDHLVGWLDLPGWEHHTIGFWEGGSLLAAIAAVTERVAIGPFVVDVPFRNPALLAKMADMADVRGEARGQPVERLGRPELGDIGRLPAAGARLATTA